MPKLSLDDKRIESLANRVLEQHFPGDSKVNIVIYTECLVKETVLECMKQLAFPIDIKDNLQSSIVNKQWDHLARRFGIHEGEIE